MKNLLKSLLSNWYWLLLLILVIIVVIIPKHTNIAVSKIDYKYKYDSLKIVLIQKDLELSDDDIEDLSAFILDLDESGMSAFGKAMNDPALFTRAAFWILNEDKIVEELTK